MKSYFFHQIRKNPAFLSARRVSPQRPPSTTSPFSAYYSRRFFTAVRLHDQFNLNVRVAQEIGDHFTIYALFKHILDDYNPDPFNPGPGFTCYGGFEAKL